MKLIYCPHCEDIFRLMIFTRKCICGESGGRYLDDNRVRVKNDSVVLGIDSDQFSEALLKTNNPDISAWIVDSGNDTITHV